MLIATVPLTVLRCKRLFLSAFPEDVESSIGVCGREHSLVVDGGVDAAQFKQQLVHPALGQLAHDEQTVAETAAGVLPASGMPQAAETAEAPAGASAPKAAVRLAGTGVPGAAGMPAGTARPDAIAPSVLWYIRNGNLLAVQFQPDATGFIFEIQCR